MGRTLPTIIQALAAEAESWKNFRRALRREDQEAFDALWRRARRHAAAAAMASRPTPIESAFMAMLVGLERELEDLDRQLDELEACGRPPVEDAEAGARPGDGAGMSGGDAAGRGDLLPGLEGGEAGAAVKEETGGAARDPSGTRPR